MNPAFFIALRYSRARHGFLSLVTWVAATGLALGIAVLVVVLSVINGFEQALRERVLGALPHAIIFSRNETENWSALAQQIRSVPGVSAVAPITPGEGMLVAADEVRAVQLTGIDPVAETQVSILEQYLITGSLADLAPGSFHVLLGARLAQQLGVAPGDQVTLVLPEPRVTVLGLMPRQKLLRVSGLFALGTDLDETGAYVHLLDANRLLRVPGEAAGIRLRLEDLFATHRVLRDITERYGNAQLHGYDWRYSYGNLHAAIVLQKRIMLVLLSLLVAVAAFNLVSMLAMLVRSRRRELAILRTLARLPGCWYAYLPGKGCSLLLPGRWAACWSVCCWRIWHRRVWRCCSTLCSGICWRNISSANCPCRCCMGICC